MPVVNALLTALLLLLGLGRARAQNFIPTTYAFLAQFGSYGTGNGKFNIPDFAATDGSGNVFITDQQNNRVEKFDRSGNYLIQFGNPGSGNGHFGPNGPSGIAVDGSGNVFVADYGNNRVEKFDNNGSYIGLVGNGPGSGPGQFNAPYGIAVDGSGNVFVADYGNTRIEKFDNNGNYLAQFGNAQSINSVGVAVDGSGTVFVSNLNDNTVQKFDNNGNYIGEFGSAAGNGASTITIDGQGNVFVLYYYSYMIAKFDNSGNYLGQFGSGPGSSPGQLGNVGNNGGGGGIAVDGNGHVIVVDTINNRIETFAQVPTTTPSFTPNVNHTGGTLALPVTDPVATVEDTLYSLDGKAFQNYTNPISIDDSFLHILLYQSADSAGNQEDLHAFYFAAAPVALSLSPDHVTTGNGNTRLTLGGAGFDNTSSLCIDGNPLPTTYIDVNNLQATVPAIYVAIAGSHQITVKDTAISGFVSNPLILRVGKARLAVSAALSRDASNNVVATLLFKNTGPIGADATGVTLNTATLTNLMTAGSPLSTTSPTLPYGVSTVTAGGSQTLTLTFPTSVGTSGQTVRLAFKGVFTGGTFSVSGQKKLP
jgi:sugar lactone lactonase YvrE